MELLLAPLQVLFALIIVWGIPLVIYLMCAIPALRELKGCALDETSRAVWTLVIVAVPIMGALAFWIMQPGERVTP
jgi:hypothetical protein